MSCLKCDIDEGGKNKRKTSYFVTSSIHSFLMRKTFTKDVIVSGLRIDTGDSLQSD